MRHRLTASKITLARACSWWARGDVEIPASESSAAAELGTALHKVAEEEAEAADETRVDTYFRRVVCGEIEELVGGELSESERASLAALATSWRDWWPSFQRRASESPETGAPVMITELAVALDVDTGRGRILACLEPRDYSTATEREVPGTIDLAACLEEGVPALIDYKTGRATHRVADHVDQLLHNAASYTSLTGHRGAMIGVAHVTPEGVRLDERRVDGFDFAIITAELRQILDGLPSADPVPGLHCEDLYCPARAVCPVTRGMLIHAGLDVDTRRRLPLVGEPRTNEEALAKFVAAGLLEAVVEQYRREAKAFADTRGGITAPDGRVYRGRETTRETPRLDVAGAREALRLVLGDATDQAIKTKVTTSFSAIRAAAKAAKLPQGDAEDAARAALREVGALKVSRFPVYEFKQEKAL